MPSQRSVAWETTINEFFTHLTTLSSGSIVVLAALSDELHVSGMPSRFLAVAGVIGFVIAIGAGLRAKLAVARLTSLDEDDESYAMTTEWMTRLGATAFIAFGGALLALSILAVTSFITRG